MLRKTLTILSLLGLLLSVGLWGASYFRFRCFTASHVIDLEGGAIAIIADSNPPDTILMFTLNFGSVEAARAFDEYAERLREMMALDRCWMIQGYAGLKTDWTPQTERHPLMIIIPLWIPAVLFGAVFSYACALPLRRRKRKKLGLCLKCGYNLKGLTEPRCPECNTSFDERLLKKDA